MIIYGPDGKAVRVNEEGYINANCVGHGIQHHANLIHRSSYGAVISVTPTGAGDCFFYIKNDDDENLIVTSLKLYSASAEIVQVKLGDSGTVGGTHAALTPVNRFAGAGEVADVTCESGVDITGFSGGSVVDVCPSIAVPFIWRWESSLVVPKNSLLSLYAVTGAVAITATLGFYFCGMCQ